MMAIFKYGEMQGRIIYGVGVGILFSLGEMEVILYRRAQAGIPAIYIGKG
jgi:hypothetical protein